MSLLGDRQGHAQGWAKVALATAHLTAPLELNKSLFNFGFCGCINTSILLPCHLNFN